MEWLNKIFDGLLSLVPHIVTIEPIEYGAKITGGSHYKIIGPGWYIIWPVIQNIIVMEVVTQVVDLLPQTIMTKDGTELVVSGGIRYRIADIEKALFNVQDVDKAISTLALGVIFDHVRTHTHEECSNVEAIKAELRRGLAEAASGWGLKIEKVYLTDFGRVRSLRLFGDNLRNMQ